MVFRILREEKKSPARLRRERRNTRAHEREGERRIAITVLTEEAGEAEKKSGRGVGWTFYDVNRKASVNIN